MFNIPNSLSALRLLLAPVMLYFAWRGLAQPFIVLLGVALLSDLLDGFLARLLNQVTEFGALLDSWGDFATYWVMTIGVWWLWPEVIEREAFFIAVIGVSYVLPRLVGVVKFQRFILSYHTWGAKASGALISSSVFVMVAFEVIWPFHLAALFFLLAELEEVAITLVLRSWRSDIASVWHLRREGKD
ncbi:MAG: CDP-alcohol phosphatidyltransferase family protein [Gammaproteobacteria bacterium]|nr:CDP-alcohol phosphatidyltransferase family protein [Gammaproteobacteria bacterium]